MGNGHLTKAELKELLSWGDREPCVTRLLEHHLETCRTCRESMASLEREISRAGERDLDCVVAEAVEAAVEEARRVGVLEARAQRDLRELLRLPTAERLRRINRAIRRFSNPALADLLLEHCRRAVTKNPWQALALADCALEVAKRVPDRDYPPAFAMTLLARAHAHRGNALRATGELHQAGELIALALHTFENEGNSDPLVEAELLMLAASLHIDQRQPAEAVELLDRARRIYARLQESGRVARVLVKKSMVWFDAGELDQALAVGAEALAAIDPVAEPKLMLNAEHNYVAFLQELGRYREAWERMRANAPLYEAHPDPWTQLRRRWLDGLIHRGLGDRVTAHECLAAARQGFEAEGLSFQAALAGLDLAYLLLEEGRSAEVKTLAESMVPVFMAQELHRDATAAILLFQQAAHQEALTTVHLRQLIRYLSRLKPGAREAVS